MRPIDLIRKSLAVLLAAVLLIGLVPAGAAAASLPASEPSDVWDAIDALEEEIFAETPRLMGADDTYTVEDYAQVVDDVAAMVVTRSDYVEGSLQRNGDFLFWKTTDGEINAYSPDLRAEDEIGGIPVIGGTGSSGETQAGTVQLMDGKTDSQNAAKRALSGEATSRDLAVFTPWTFPTGGTEKEARDKDPSFTSIVYEQAKATAVLTGGQADWIQGLDVTVETIARAIESYGMVFIFTHGRTDYHYPIKNELRNEQYSNANDSYVQLQSGEGLTVDDYTYAVAQNKDYYVIEEQDWGSGVDGNGEPLEQEYPYKNAGKVGAHYYPHCFKFRKKGHRGDDCRYAVDGYVIARHMNKRAPENMVYFLSCLTMATDGLWRPLRDKGVEAVYGYSQCVTFKGGEAMLPPFMDGLRQGMTAGEAFEYMQKRYGYNWDHEYGTESKEDAVSQHIAFPYLVSPEDPYFSRDDYAGTVEQDAKSTWRLPLLSDWDPETGTTTVSIVLALEELVHVPFLTLPANINGINDLQLVGDLPNGIQRKIVAGIDSGNYRNKTLQIVARPHKTGYFEPTLSFTASDNVERKYKFKILVTDNTETKNSSQIAAATLGHETDISFQLTNDDGEKFFSVEQTYGNIPSGLTLLFDGSSAPRLVGTPTLPATYTAVFTVRKNSGKLFSHRLSVQVSPAETLDTSQSVVLYGDSLSTVNIDTGLENATIRSVGKTTGSIPGMTLSMSMDQAPRLSGRPTTAGDFTMRMQFYLTDGRLVNHTIYATVQKSGDSADRYVVDVSTGQSGIIEWEDYKNYIRPALRAAAEAGQIGLDEGPQKTTIDVDNDGTWDIEYSKVMNSYRFQVLSTASQSGSYPLDLSRYALRYLSSYTEPGAKSIEFIFSQVYGLKVYNKQVTSANRENIFKGEWYGATTNLDGVFSYDGAGTLTINGSLWNNLIDIPIVQSDIPLTINVAGYSHLGCTPSAIVANSDLTITGQGVLEVWSNEGAAIQINNGAKLTIRDTEVRTNKYKASFAAGPLGLASEGGELEIDHAHVLSFGQESAAEGFRSIKLKNCQIKTPEKGAVTDTGFVDSNGELATDVEIIPCEATYDLWIDGVQVTNVNAADILGDGDFSYSAGSKTLTINASGTHIWNHNPDRRFPMIHSAIQGLTIQADNNVILRNNGVGGCFLLEGETTLIAKHMSLVAIKNAAISVRNDGTLRIKDTPYLSIATEGGPGITGTPGFAKASDDKLILDHVDDLWIKTWNSGPAITDFAGGAGIAFGDYETGIKTPAGAKFYNGAVVDETGGPVTELVIGKVGQSGSPDPDTPDIPDDASSNYSLRVDGTLVTDLNQEDVLNNDIFSFDGDHTLTLLGGEYAVTDATIIENGISGLVVYVEKDTTLKVLGRKGVCLLALADTTVTGPGRLTLYSEGDEALGAGYGADIILDGLTLTIDGGHGIRGSGALRVNNCLLDLNTDDGAAWDFGTGIFLTDCALTAPADGSLALEEGRWCVADKDGSKALAAKIGATPAAISLTPEGDAIQYSIPLDAGGVKGSVIAAWYDQNGQMLGTRQAEITMDGTVTGTLPVEKGADVYRLFVLDADGSPVRQAWSSS